jgi:hypothetical protein
MKNLFYQLNYVKIISITFDLYLPESRDNMKHKNNTFVLIFFIIIAFIVAGFKLDFIEKGGAEKDSEAVIQKDEIKKNSNEEEKVEKKKTVKGKSLDDKNLSRDNMVNFNFEPLSEEVINKINGVSWKQGAPVELKDLSYVKVLHWGFDGKEHIGELIVHKKVAKEVAQIFRELYEAKFPIEKIKLIDEYNANDDLSMEDNNTSAFCYREVAGKKGTLSKHSYGIAIDINPIQNPYIKGEKISPAAGKEYKNRKNVKKGMIVKGDICYKVFKERGWIWGGEWKTLKDYQHFQKQIDLKKE